MVYIQKCLGHFRCKSHYITRVNGSLSLVKLVDRLLSPLNSYQQTNIFDCVLDFHLDNIANPEMKHSEDSFRSLSEDEPKSWKKVESILLVQSMNSQPEEPLKRKRLPRGRAFYDRKLLKLSRKSKNRSGKVTFDETYQGSIFAVDDYIDFRRGCRSKKLPKFRRTRYSFDSGKWSEFDYDSIESPWASTDTILAFMDSRDFEERLNRRNAVSSLFHYLCS